MRVLLENDILLLRAVEPTDIDILYQWENRSTLWSAGNTRAPYSKFALKQYILQCEKDIYESKQLRLMMVLKQSGETVGTVDLYDFDIFNSRIALGLYVENTFQGKGIAKNALVLIEDYVFRFLKINQLYTHIAKNNKASIAMFEKSNFTKSAILKNWIKTLDGYEDIVVFQEFKQD